MITFGQRIKNFRKICDMSQSELAGKLISAPPRCKNNVKYRCSLLKSICKNRII